MMMIHLTSAPAIEKSTLKTHELKDLSPYMSRLIEDNPQKAIVIVIFQGAGFCVIYFSLESYEYTPILPRLCVDCSVL